LYHIGTDKEPKSNHEMKDEADCILKAWEDFARYVGTYIRFPHCGGKLIYEDYKTAWRVRCENEGY